MKLTDLLTESTSVDELADEIVAGGPQVSEFFFKSLQAIHASLTNSDNEI
jgi:hypothetical protein